MNKVCFGFLLGLLLFTIGTNNVNAETYNVSEIHNGQELKNGDVIHNDTDSVYTWREHYGLQQNILPNEDGTLLNNAYYFNLGNANHFFKWMFSAWDEPNAEKIIDSYNGKALYVGDTVTIDLVEILGFQKTDDIEIDHYAYWVKPSEDNHVVGTTVTLENIGEYTRIIFHVVDNADNIEGCDLIVKAHKRPEVIEKKEEKEEKEEKHSEPPKTQQQIESERKNQDTLPSGTIQGIGGKKDFSFKALNPSTRDVGNQQMFADYYAKQLGYTSKVLISKDIWAPYGQTKDDKWKTKTISWKDTGAKYGDIIYIVWYCQEAHDMQFIKADVLADGTVVFTIPKSGDVSTISIVKLNK